MTTPKPPKINHYLSNLALWHLSNYCKENNIDQSNTLLNKLPRKQIYRLINQETKKEILRVQFYTNQHPRFNNFDTK